MIVERGYAPLEKIEENADLSSIRACREADGVPVLLKVLPAPGRDLARIPAAHPSRRMPVSEALDLAAALTEGLAAEHAAGLIHPDLRTDLEGYRFAHDMVQEGAYAMIPEADRPAFHLRIGRLLAGKLDLSVSQSLFDVIGHLNSAGDLVSDPAERLSLARMSLEGRCLMINRRYRLGLVPRRVGGD